MQQEATQELVERKRHQLLFVVVSGIAPTESDSSLRERGQAMIGDGYAMSVTAQIVEDMFRASKGAFRIDHPVVPEQRSGPGRKGLRLSEGLQVSMEIELALPEGALEGGDKLAAKGTAERLDEKKECAVGLDPAGVVERQPTGAHHAMEMGWSPSF